MKKKKLVAMFLACCMAFSLVNIPVKAASIHVTPKNPRISGDTVTWDCVTFGRYYQSNTTDLEPIKWRVLSVNGNDAFLLADTCLERMPYIYKNIKTGTSATWKISTVRSFLNGYGANENYEGVNYDKTTNNAKKSFKEVAFTENEQQAIINTNVVTNDNPVTHMKGGENTKDDIYLLSMEEVMNPAYGFPNNFESSETRQLKESTNYMKQTYTFQIDSYPFWWLRSPGFNEMGAAFIFGHGLVMGIDALAKSDNVSSHLTVRPVLHLDLSKTQYWENAGTVSSGGFLNNTISVSKISISGSLKNLAPGKKTTLKATVSPSNATNKGVTWKSNNTKYATVSSKGVVTAKTAGKGKTVTITAIAKDGSNVKATYKIKIAKGVVKKIKITGKSSVKAGKSIKLKAKVTASKGAYKKLKWTSSNTKYATVSSNGKVKTKKARKKKSVKITASALDGSGKKATKKIKIK